MWVMHFVRYNRDPGHVPTQCEVTKAASDTPTHASALMILRSIHITSAPNVVKTAFGDKSEYLLNDEKTAGMQDRGVAHPCQSRPGYISKQTFSSRGIRP